MVGRNNTGKSALLEALSLVSTGGSSWHDSLGDDLLEPIIKRRGGWEYASMMIKIGEQYAEIHATGDNTVGTVQITRKLEDLSDKVGSKVSSGISDYFGSVISKYINRMERISERAALSERRISRQIMFSQLEKEINNMKENIWKQIKVCIGYYDKKHEEAEYALVMGEELQNLFRKKVIQIEESLLIPLDFSLEEIIRSPSQRKSRTIFLLTPSIQYLKELQRRLVSSGDLLNLINTLRDRISYFTDIREVDNNFLVFIKGLKRPVPLEAMGDGFRAKLAILSAIATAKRGIALLEEPEIRLHPGFMSSIADQITETAARRELQYIISTHSLDFLEYLLRANAELIMVVRMYKIEKANEIDYEVLDGKEALKDLNELKLDLREV